MSSVPAGLNWLLAVVSLLIAVCWARTMIADRDRQNAGWLLVGFLTCSGLVQGSEAWHGCNDVPVTVVGLQALALLFGVTGVVTRVASFFAMDGRSSFGRQPPRCDRTQGQTGQIMASSMSEVESCASPGLDAPLLDAQLLNSIIENLTTAIFVKEAVGLRYIYCNRAGLQYLGLTNIEVLGRTQAEILPYEQGRIFEELDRRVLATGRLMDVADQVVTTPLHGVRSVHETKIPLFDSSDTITHVLELAEDITARMEAEAELRQAKVFLESIVEHIPSTVFVKDAKTLRYVLMNKTGLEALACRREQVVGKFDYELFPPSQAADRMADDRRVLDSGTAVDLPEELVASRSMGARYLHTKKIPLYNDRGEPSYLLGIAEDITVRKKAESDLRQAKAFLESIVENIPHMIFVKRAADFRFVSVNRAAEALIGRSRAELVGKNDFDFFPPHDAQRYLETDREVLRSGAILDIPEEAIESASDGRRILHTKKIPLMDDTGVPLYLLGISEDITERIHYEELNRRREEELAHAQRLIAVGEIGATLAHEFNQPVAAIANYAEGALMRIRSGTGTPPEIVDVFERILQLAVHAGHVVRSLRDLARKQVSDPEWIDFNELVRETMRLLNATTTRANVQVSLRLAADTPAIQACRLQLQQLLVNLVMNAVEALNGIAADARRILIATEHPVDNALVLRVEDSGKGLPCEVAERLFEPFVTTKPHGVGLGLSICHSIVETHRGTIRVCPSQLQGLALEITLPTEGVG